MGCMVTFTAIIQKEESQYVATCPEVGTTSQESSIEEAIANVKEATELYLEETSYEPKARPILATFEVVPA